MINIDEIISEASSKIKEDGFSVVIKREKGSNEGSFVTSGNDVEVMAALSEGLVKVINRAPVELQSAMWRAHIDIASEKLGLPSNYDDSTDNEDSACYVHIDKKKGDSHTNITMCGDAESILCALADSLGKALQSVDDKERNEVMFKLFSHVTDRMNAGDAK